MDEQEAESDTRQSETPVENIEEVSPEIGQEKPESETRQSKNPEENSEEVSGGISQEKDDGEVESFDDADIYCQRCTEVQACCYCPTCRFALCRDCSFTIHSVGAFSSHPITEEIPTREEFQPVPGRPEWEPDKARDTCTDCKILFGVLTRRHHCRACGKLFCNACTTSRIELPPEFKYSSSQRVCDTCFLILHAHLKLTPANPSSPGLPPLTRSQSVPVIRRRIGGAGAAAPLRDEPAEPVSRSPS